MKLLRIICILMICVTTLLTTNLRGQVVQKNYPRVVHFDVPYYPNIARYAHVTGTVHIKVQTDGTKVVSTQIVDGPAMLRESTAQNVRSWQFTDHTPTSFIISFIYKLTDNMKENPSADSIVLHLPTEVEIDSVIPPPLNKDN